MKPVDAAETLTAKELERIEEMLDLWDDARSKGESIDLRPLCEDAPHLLEIVLERIQRLQAFDDQLTSASSGHLHDGEELKGEDTLPVNQTIDSRLIAQSEVMELEFHDAGGLGKVYRANDFPLNRQIAVKLIRRRNANDEEQRRNFLREAEITGRLEHPGVVSIYAIGETIDGRCFYTMPLLRGGTLDAAIQAWHDRHPNQIRASAPEFRDLINRLISVCKTIAYAHSRGIAHRDLKPQNIMLGKYGETVVIDWGMAGTFSRSGRSKEYDEETIDLKHSDDTESSTRGYTLHYASPEQLRGATTLGPASDIYSLGIILYRILSGQTPYAGHRASDARQLALAGKVPEIRSLKRGVPRALQAICMQAIALRAEARYHSALAMAEDLERYLADLPVTSRRDSVVERIARFGRKRWQFALAVLFVLCVLTFGSMVAAVNQGVLRHQAVEASKLQLQTATMMAAQAGAAEIDRRWRMLELEAASSQLRELMMKLEDDPQNQKLWQQIQNWLEGRFIQYSRIDGVAFDSWFVNFHDGTQVARTPQRESIGENFAYRAYFHGQGSDFPKHESAPPSRFPVLSTVYTSTNSGTMKVAFTVPIWQPEGNINGRVIGRLGMSVEVGDLQIFGNLDAATHLPLLVETRRYACDAGEAFGLIIDRRQQETNQDSSRPFEHLAASTLESMLSINQSSGSPTSKTPKTTAMLSHDFVDPFSPQQQTTTTAAFCPIRVPGRPDNINETGWLVVLQAKPTE